MFQPARWRLGVNLGLMLLLLLPATLLLAAPGASAASPMLQSQSIGPFGGMVTAIAFSPAYETDRHIFAAAGASIFKSTDGAQNWSAVGSIPFPSGAGYSPRVNRLAISPNFISDQTIIAATTKGLFRSTDRGVNWSLVSADLDIRVVALSPTFGDDGLAFAGGFRTGLLRSTNRGASWRRDGNGLDGYDGFIGSIAFSPNYGADRLILVGAINAGLLLSTTAGASWSSQSLPGSDTAATVIFSPDFARDRTLFVSGSSRGPWRSTDDGTNWTAINSNFQTFISDLYVSPNYAQDRTLLGVSVQAPSYRSTNGGISWSDLAFGVGGLNEDYSGMLAFSPTYATDRLLLRVSSQEQGIFASRDVGTNWTATNNGLTALAIEAITPGPGVLFAAGPNGTFRSLDRGGSWEQVLSGALLRVGPARIRVSPAFERDRTVFSGQLGLARSRDGGATWTGIFPPDAPAGVQPALTIGSFVKTYDLTPSFASDQTIFAYVDDYIGWDIGFYRSRNAGTSWQLVGPGPADGMSALLVAPDYPTSRTLFSVAGSSISRSTNDGVSFAQVYNGGQRFVERDSLLFASPNYSQDQTLFALINGQLLLSTDGGTRWAPFYTTAVVEAFAVSPDYRNDQILYLAIRSGADSQIYRSRDRGATWNSYYTLRGATIINLTIDDATLYLGTSNNSAFTLKEVAPLELTGFIVDSYVERGQCYDVLVVLRNNSEAAITRSINIAEQATYFNNEGQPAALPQGRADRFFDCDTGMALPVNGTINRSLTVPANSIAQLRLSLRHDWDWIERRTVASSIYSVLSDRIKAVLVDMAIKGSDLRLIIESAQLYEEFGKIVYEKHGVRPLATYRYTLQVEELSTQLQRDVEIVVNEFQQGWLRGSFRSAEFANINCLFWKMKWAAPSCALAIFTAQSLYLAAYGEVALLALPANGTNYRELVDPQPLTLSVLDKISAPAQRVYVEQHIQVEALQRAALESLQRANAAAAAGDIAWALRQRQHARQLLEQAAKQLGAASRQAELLVTGLAPTTVEEIRAYQAALERDGFDATMSTLFTDIGVASVEQEALKSYLLALPVENWPDPSIIPAVHELQQREMLRLARTVAPTIYLPLVRR